MAITNMRCNHVQQPLGYMLAGKAVLSWVTEAEQGHYQKKASVSIALDKQMKQLVHQSGEREDIDGIAYAVELNWQPRRRYYWQVNVWTDADELVQSEVSWFETGKRDEPWQAKWIAAHAEYLNKHDADNRSNSDDRVSGAGNFSDSDGGQDEGSEYDLPISQQELCDHPILSKTFQLEGVPDSARLYITGAGLYEASLNGMKIGEEYLTPYCNDYSSWLQVQSYDVSKLLVTGSNELSAMLGPGWAIGRFGLGGGKERQYAQQPALLAELIIELADGATVIIGTDDSWHVRKSPVISSGIYDGEVWDANLELAASQAGVSARQHELAEVEQNTSDQQRELPAANLAGKAAAIVDKPVTGQLTDRLSLPVVCKEILPVAELIITPQGHTVLDFGQNMSGWVVFETEAPQGTAITLEFGEIMQDGELYRGNLNSAKQTFTYISNGKPALARPHFTYFGFRYVQVSGYQHIKQESLAAWVLYSDMEQTMELETSNSLLNRLFQNALWGQKSNFLDVPTDCPQRDERLGWTGDAQVFAQTAGFNMDTAAFFRKYMLDVLSEQRKLGGAVPTVVPKMIGGEAYSAAWGDAATIIPWQLYVQYGDRELLQEHWESMRSWVEYVRTRAGESHLWCNDFHFGDWLALDSVTGSLSGGTLKDLIATAFYAFSVKLLTQAAQVLDKVDEARQYAELYEHIREAFLAEFVTPNGRIACVTQTAHIVPLYMGLLPQEWRQRTADSLAELIVKAGYRLQTGFVGTPYLCKVLSDYGYVDLAYKLLLNEELPGWLYPIKMGATTIWERWDSVMPDGKIAENGMNSLNHYAYGSIVSWMIGEAAGIQPLQHTPAYRQFRLAPEPNGRLQAMKAVYYSRAGRIESGWELLQDGRLLLTVRIPFNTTAELILPHCRKEDLQLKRVQEQAIMPDMQSEAAMKKTEVEVKLQAENEQKAAHSALDIWQEGSNCHLKLHAGNYELSYTPLQSYLLRYNTYSDLRDLMADEQTAAIVKLHIPNIEQKQQMIYNMKLANLHEMQFVTGITNEQLQQLDEALDAYYGHSNHL